MTPSYAPPEFFDRVTSSQSDQYSLAVTFCQLRGGRLPFEGHPAVVMSGHLLREPDLSMVPGPERPAVARALAKSPHDRWPSCRAFVQAVMAAEGVRVPATVAPADSTWRITTRPDPSTRTPPAKPDPLSEWPPVRPDSRRWFLLAGAAALLIAGLVLLWAYRSASSRPAESSRDGTARLPGGSSDAPSLSKESPAARSHIESGLAFLAKDDKGRAITEFDEAIRLDPKAARAFAGRAIARNNGGRSRAPATTKKHQAAKSDVDEALRLDPNLALGHAARGLALSVGTAPDFQEALDECDKAIHLDPRLAFGPFVRAQILFQRGSLENQKADLRPAVRNCTEAIRLDPKLVIAYYLRGNIFRSMENYDRALADFDEAKRLDPESSKSYYFRGMVFQAKGENDQAIRNYSEAIRRTPDQVPAYNKRAEVYDEIGDTARAEADRKEVQRIMSRGR